MSKLVKKNLKIEGMYCTACAMTIDFDLEDLDGVKSVKTSYLKQQTEIEYDEEIITMPKILKQIEITGYKSKSDTDH